MTEIMKSYIPLRGMIVWVYRPSRDSSTNGVTAQADAVLLVGDGVAEVSEEHDNTPTLRLVRRNIAGRPYVHAEPVYPAKGARMFGGNFIYSSDSRFRHLNEYPIPVHDREEY